MGFPKQGWNTWSTSIALTSPICITFSVVPSEQIRELALMTDPSQEYIQPKNLGFLLLYSSNISLRILKVSNMSFAA